MHGAKVSCPAWILVVRRVLLQQKLPHLIEPSAKIATPDPTKCLLFVPFVYNCIVRYLISFPSINLMASVGWDQFLSSTFLFDYLFLASFPFIK
jgi:hypothetical protein